MFSLFVHHKLQTMSIGVMEINAVWIPRTTADLHPVLFQLGFERFVRAALNVEGQMVEIVAGYQRSITLLLEQGDPLMAAVQKRLGIVFPVDGHAQKLRVELLGACHILHMQNNVIEAIDLDHRSLPPKTSLRAGRQGPAGLLLGRPAAHLIVRLLMHLVQQFLALLVATSGSLLLVRSTSEHTGSSL